MAKKKTKQDRWPELCEIVRGDDGLPSRDSGAWAEEKLYFWYRYLEITTTAMVGNPNWPAGLVYVDLFTGPGVCTIRQSDRRIPGSPLIAANTPKPFTKILLVEKDPEMATACEQRMQKSAASSRYKMFVGDCNTTIDEVVREIPSGALTLAFIDPTGLHVHFETIKRLSERRADLLILFPDAIDVVRNIDIYIPNLNSNLDQVLGPGSNWRKEWAQLGSCDGINTRRLFARIYQEQIERHLGYSQFRDKVIDGSRGPLYRLVYASKSMLGLKFWNEALKMDAQRQKELPWDE